MKVLIIGGTSGIGLALAIHYLNQGDAVAVCGRDVNRVCTSIKEQHKKLSLFEFDIADKGDIANALNCFAKNGLDLLIVSAGFYFNNRKQKLNEATSLRMIQTNISGLNHAFELTAERMLEQKYGHLVAISSIAGLVEDYPGASLYSATKRSVISLCDTYRIALSPFSIAVTAIVPGYINTAKLRELNNGDASHKRFILSENEAVKQIVYAIDHRLSIHVFPSKLKYIVQILNLMPKLIRQLVT